MVCTLGQCRGPDQAAYTPETGTRHHRVPAGHHSFWRPIERFALYVEGDVVGRESAFRNGRRRRLTEPHRGGGRREDCPDLKSGGAAHENCDYMEPLDMVALVHLVI